MKISVKLSVVMRPTALMHTLKKLLALWACWTSVPPGETDLRHQAWSSRRQERDDWVTLKLQRKRIIVIQPRSNEGMDYCLRMPLWFHLHQLPQVKEAGDNHRDIWEFEITVPGLTRWLESGPAAVFLLMLYLEAVFFITCWSLQTIKK